VKHDVEGASKGGAWSAKPHVSKSAGWDPSGDAVLTDNSLADVALHCVQVSEPKPTSAADRPPASIVHAAPQGMALALRQAVQGPWGDSAATRRTCVATSSFATHALGG
jgi:hypothetical protein